MKLSMYTKICLERSVTTLHSHEDTSVFWRHRGLRGGTQRRALPSYQIEGMKRATTGLKKLLPQNLFFSNYGKTLLKF